MKFIMPALASFLLTAMIMPLVIRIAKACNCLDVPGGRRLHRESTPRWGGIGFFAGVLPLLTLQNGTGSLTAYLVASILLVGMGAVDDIRPLGCKAKFAGMTAAATIVVFGGDLVVHHLGTYGVLGDVELGWLSIPFTYLSIIGITNAINLLDGLNGLAGGVSLLGFLFLGIAALQAGNLTVALVCFAFVGALGAFLLFNFPNARVFMGDSGSLFLGFSLSFLAISLTQGRGSSLDPMFPVLVLLIPIFDTLRVLLVRLANGKNPFQADTLHLHYLIVRRDVSALRAVLLFWSLTALFGLAALTLTERSSVDFLTVVLYASLSLGLFTVALTRKRRSAEILLAAQQPSEPGAGLAALLGVGAFRVQVAPKGWMTAFIWLVILGIMLSTGQVSSGELSVPKDNKQDLARRFELPATADRSRASPGVRNDRGASRGTAAGAKQTANRQKEGQV